MSKELRYFKTLVADAPTSADSERMLRDIVRLAAGSAPLSDLLILCNTLIEIRERDLRRVVESN